MKLIVYYQSYEFNTAGRDQNRDFLLSRVPHQYWINLLSIHFLRPKMQTLYTRRRKRASLAVINRPRTTSKSVSLGILIFSFLKYYQLHCITSRRYHIAVLDLEVSIVGRVFNEAIYDYFSLRMPWSCSCQCWARWWFKHGLRFMDNSQTELSCNFKFCLTPRGKEWKRQIPNWKIWC